MKTIRILIIAVMLTIVIGCKTTRTQTAMEDWEVRQAEIIKQDKAEEKAEANAIALQTYQDYIADGPCCGR